MGRDWCRRTSIHWCRLTKSRLITRGCNLPSSSTRLFAIYFLSRMREVIWVLEFTLRRLKIFDISDNSSTSCNHFSFEELLLIPFLLFLFVMDWSWWLAGGSLLMRFIIIFLWDGVFFFVELRVGLIMSGSDGEQFVEGVESLDVFFLCFELFYFFFWKFFWRRVTTPLLLNLIFFFFYSEECFLSFLIFFQGIFLFFFRLFLGSNSIISIQSVLTFYLMKLQS